MKVDTACVTLTCCMLATTTNTHFNNGGAIVEVTAFSSIQRQRVGSIARSRSTIIGSILSSSSSSSSTSTARMTIPRPAAELKSGTALSMSDSSSSSEQDDEIARLKAMAQKLRSEAASLEADQAKERAEVARMAFEKFDTSPRDGKISAEELRLGLEKSLKTTLDAQRVQKLMDEFDVSGDGYLQIDEMVSVDQFRNKLEAYAREEKRLARQAVDDAKKEEEKSRLAEARLEILNEKDPTQTEKILSVLPYLFPLLDSLQFGRFIINDNADNPIVGLLAVLFTLYRSIPFSGFLAFLALNTLSSNPGLNRLVRFNMQQAIFLDIALFFPGLLTAVIAGIGSVAGFTIPEAANASSSTVIFGVLVVTVLYASTSSLLGISPNKIPFISQAVEDRMPTMDMFDEEGRFIPRDDRSNDDKKDNNKDDKDNTKE